MNKNKYLYTCNWKFEGPHTYLDIVYLVSPPWLDSLSYTRLVRMVLHKLVLTWSGAIKLSLSKGILKGLGTSTPSMVSEVANPTMYFLVLLGGYFNEYWIDQFIVLTLSFFIIFICLPKRKYIGFSLYFQCSWIMDTVNGIYSGLYKLVCV